MANPANGPIMNACGGMNGGTSCPCRACSGGGTRSLFKCSRDSIRGSHGIPNGSIGGGDIPGGRIGGPYPPIIFHGSVGGWCASDDAAPALWSPDGGACGIMCPKYGGK